MLYHIHQVVNPTYMEKDATLPKEYVGYVEANSLSEAFKLSQNFEKTWNPTNPCRSTSIGDIIQDDDGFHLVISNGFKRIL